MKADPSFWLIEPGRADVPVGVPGGVVEVQVPATAIGTVVAIAKPERNRPAAPSHSPVVLVFRFIVSAYFVLRPLGELRLRRTPRPPRRDGYAVAPTGGKRSKAEPRAQPARPAV